MTKIFFYQNMRTNKNIYKYNILFAYKYIIFSFFFILVKIINPSYSNELEFDLKKNTLGSFDGRLAHINETASLIRVAISFDNYKFLNQNDALVFWHPQNNEKNCKGILIGKTIGQYLIKVEDMENCMYMIKPVVGMPLKFFSRELQENIMSAQDLVEVLMKKRIALESKKNKEQKNLDQYFEKIEAVNSRYALLKEKLEQEWQKELENLQIEKLQHLKNFQIIENNLDEIDLKLTLYKVNDKNSQDERWSLDSRIYLKK